MFQITGTFLFLRLLCVVFADLKNIRQYCNNWNFQQKNKPFNFYIDAWYLIITQAENAQSTATVDLNITQQNPPLVTTQFEMNAKHSKRRSHQVFNMTSTSFTLAHLKIRSLQRMLGNDVAVFVREFGATHSLQQWVLAHDSSSSISVSNSDERYAIPKSYEFLSLVKFDLWFCNSLVHLPDSKSIHWQNQRCHQCAHCEVVHFLEALSYCQCFSILLTTYSEQQPFNLH